MEKPEEGGERGKDGWMERQAYRQTIIDTQMDREIER